MDFTFSGEQISFIFFLIALVLFLWYSFVIIYHFIRFGIGKTPKVLALLFFVSSFLLSAATVFAYTRIDWTKILHSLQALL